MKKKKFLMANGNSRMYPRFPPQLEKNHETYHSLRDEAQFPCIACRAMPCSQ